MVTTIEAPRHPFAASRNVVAEWAIEDGLRASGRWEDPVPEPEIDDAAAYALPDEEPAEQRVFQRDAEKRTSAMAALASITGLDIDVPETAILPCEPVLPPPRTEDAPEPSWRAKDAKFRAERGIIRRHSKLPPSKTTKGRRDAYLRSLVKAGRFATGEEADKAIPRRPSATRYGREQAARA